MYIRKIQIDMVMSKTNEQRLRQCTEMIDFSYTQNIEQMKIRNKSSDLGLAKLAYIESCYKNDISKEYFDFIKSNFNNN